jgi:adenine-specific DNA methylase
MATRTKPDTTRTAPGRRPRRFASLPARTLLEAGELPIEDLAGLALREGQSTNPLYRVHRWFARRLGTQFRGMLAALTLPGCASAEAFWERYRGDIPLDGALVLDPFVGGGTSLVEASRCGARVVGYDIDPVATLITRFELACAGREVGTEEAQQVCDAVSARLAYFHRTALEGGGEATVLHHFWVEVRDCPSCERQVEVHPHYQLAHDEARGKQWAFCRGCHAVRELPFHRRSLRCDCGVATAIHEGPLEQGKVTCPHCRRAHGLADRDASEGPPRWRLFAQEYVLHDGPRASRHFKRAADADRALYDEAAAALEEEGALAPGRRIPSRGRADRRPLLHGFRRYWELFNARQLLHLTLLGRALRRIRDEAERRLLTLAFSEHLTTNCMYAAYAFGYRRVSPLFSIHSYRHITRPVELNPWLAGVGRGTFPNVLAKARKAVDFACRPSDLVPGGGRRDGGGRVGPADGVVLSDPSAVARGEASAAVVAASSEGLTGLPDESVDLILTDPPYFDNLSYSELSDFYLAWHQALGIAEPPFDDGRRHAPIVENLAVRGRGDEASAEYRERLAAIFRGCRRVLKTAGVCVFTYHHRSAAAWLALGEALARSGLHCTGVVPLRGEGQGGLHSYDGTLKWDAVLVCRRRHGRTPPAGAAVVIGREDLACAEQEARSYAAQLGADARIGFREPDRLNFYRACLVARAVAAPLRPGRLPLATALQSVPAL